MAVDAVAVLPNHLDVALAAFADFHHTASHRAVRRKASGAVAGNLVGLAVAGIRSAVASVDAASVADGTAERSYAAAEIAVSMAAVAVEEVGTLRNCPAAGIAVALEAVAEDGSLRNSQAVEMAATVVDMLDALRRDSV